MVDHFGWQMPTDFPLSVAEARELRDILNHTVPDVSADRKAELIMRGAVPCSRAQFKRIENRLKHGPLSLRLVRGLVEEPRG